MLECLFTLTILQCWSIIVHMWAHLTNQLPSINESYNVVVTLKRNHFLISKLKTKPSIEKTHQKSQQCLVLYNVRGFRNECWPHFLIEFWQFLYYLKGKLNWIFLHCLILTDALTIVYGQPKWIEWNPLFRAINIGSIFY